MTDDHIFITQGRSYFVETSDRYKPFRYESAVCKYCDFATFKNEIGEYLGDNKCLTKEEKIIKDLLE